MMKSNGLARSHFCQGIIQADTGNESINRKRTNIFCFVVLKRIPLINVDHEEAGIFVSLT